MSRLRGWFGDRSRAGAIVLAAAVALVVSFVGSSSAAILIGSREIKDGSITAADVHAGAVRGVDVRDHSITAADVQGGVLRGPQGPDGLPGAPGSPGQASLNYPNVPATIPPRATVTWEVPCPSGTTAIGGGVSTTTPGIGHMVRSAPIEDGSGWRVGFANRDLSADASAFGWAVCVNQS